MKNLILFPIGMMIAYQFFVVKSTTGGVLWTIITVVAGLRIYIIQKNGVDPLTRKQ